MHLMQNRAVKEEKGKKEGIRHIENKKWQT